MSGQNDSFAKIMLHFDGANGGTTFTDDSLLRNTFTAHGNANTATASFSAPQFGTASGKFDGTTDFITCPDVAALRPGTGDFTIDFWIRYNAGSVNHTVFDKGYIGANAMLVQSDASASPKLQFFTNAGVQIAIETTGTAPGAWVHKAIVRSGSTVTIYSGGTANGTGSTALALSDTSQISIGARGSDGAFSVNGNIDEFRYSVGIARWTSNFTPPTAPYATELESVTATYVEAGGSALFSAKMGSVAGSYALVGNAAAFKTSIGGAAGSFVEVGSSATALMTLAAVAANYAVVGFQTRALTLIASGGAYVVSGNAANVIVLEAESAATYLVAGNAATLTRDFINWFPHARPTGSWTAETKPSSTWTPVAPPSAIWTPDNAQFIPAPVTE